MGSFLVLSLAAVASIAVLLISIDRPGGSRLDRPGLTRPPKPPRIAG